MPARTSSFLFPLLYPLAFLALIIGGPVLLYPYLLSLFTFVAFLDAGIVLVFGALVIVLHVLYSVVPDEVRTHFADWAANSVGKSRVRAASFLISRFYRAAAVLLLAMTAHPVFAAISLLACFALTAFYRLMARIHRANG